MVMVPFGALAALATGLGSALRGTRTVLASRVGLMGALGLGSARAAATATTSAAITPRPRLITAADELGDLDAEVVFDDDHLPVRHELVVDVEAHRIAGVLIELHDRTGRQFEHIAHRQLAGTELYGDFDLNV
jgi:hypothetical protein